jgi:hypothetical protein
MTVIIGMDPHKRSATIEAIREALDRFVRPGVPAQRASRCSPTTSSITSATSGSATASIPACVKRCYRESRGSSSDIRSGPSSPTTCSNATELHDWQVSYTSASVRRWAYRRSARRAADRVSAVGPAVVQGIGLPRRCSVVFLDAPTSPINPRVENTTDVRNSTHGEGYLDDAVVACRVHEALVG